MIPSASSCSTDVKDVCRVIGECSNCRNDERLMTLHMEVQNILALHVFTAFVIPK